MEHITPGIEGPLHVTQLLRRQPDGDRVSVIALGTFDGVHKGHQAILSRAIALRDRLQSRLTGKAVEAVVFTFDRLPVEVLRPDKAPGRLMTTEARCQRMLALGIDRVVLASFDEAMIRLEPEAFVDEILFSAFHVGGIVVGFNYTFGYRGRGNVALLAEKAKAHGVAVDVVQRVTSGEDVVSSSLIRELIRSGDCERARELLTKPFFLEGEVVDGEKKGRILGYPTANLQPCDRLVIPADGVYLTRVERSGTDLGHALTVISDRPTFQGRQRSIESHILDFDGNLYGTRLRLHFLRYMRPIVRFGDPQALKAQIERDVAQAKDLLLRCE